MVDRAGMTVRGMGMAASKSPVAPVIPVPTGIQSGGMMTPFILKYRLEMEHWPYRKEEVQRLERGRSGVYALWMPYGECLYVGKSETCLRRRLLQHLQRETNPI